MAFMDLHGERAYTLDEYIALLQALKAKDPAIGGLPVQRWSAAKGRHSAPAPEMAFEKSPPILRGERRAPTTSFWQRGYDSIADQGDPVVRI